MKFMSGRYGLDALFYVLFAISAVLVVVNMFVGSIILQLVIDAIMIYAFYRVLSRNIAARRRENLLVTGLAHEIKKRRSSIFFKEDHEINSCMGQKRAEN